MVVQCKYNLPTLEENQGLEVLHSSRDFTSSLPQLFLLLGYLELGNIIIFYYFLLFSILIFLLFKY